MPARIVWIPEQFADTSGSIREDEHEDTIASPLQRGVSGLLSIDGVGIFWKCRVRLDGIAGPFVDVPSEGVTLFRRPSLLVTGLAAVVFGEQHRRAGPLGVVRFEIAFLDAPATPGRDIAVIGLYGILFESSVTSEVTSILPEYSFVKVLEGGFSVDVVGGDSSLIIATVIASRPLDKPLEFASCVPTVVPALAATAFSLVLKVPLEGPRE